MKPIECPTCGEHSDAVSRNMAGGPAFLSPCGHFVEVLGLKPPALRSHSTYGADLREHEIDWRCWETWRLTTSRGGKQVAGNPPVEWVRGYIRANA